MEAKERRVQELVELPQERLPGVMKAIPVLLLLRELGRQHEQVEAQEKQA